MASLYFIALCGCVGHLLGGHAVAGVAVGLAVCFLAALPAPRA